MFYKAFLYLGKLMEIRTGNDKGNCWNRQAFEQHAARNRGDNLVIACQGCVTTPVGRQCTASMTGDTNPTSETVAGKPVDVANIPVYGARIVEPEDHRQARETREAAEQRTVQLPPGWLSE